MDLSRHRSYFDPIKHGKPIVIIGAGATGSRVFEALINLGLRNITVYDNDIVEEHNLANQLYGHDDVYEAKVDGLDRWLRWKVNEHENGVHPKTNFIRKRVEGDMRIEMDRIVFLLTDTMDSRREIATNSLRLNPKVELVIETRMAITHGNVNMFNPNSVHEYVKWRESLFSDDEGEMSMCGTSLSIGTTASIIANLAVNMMINYLIIKSWKCIDYRADIMLNPAGIYMSTWGKHENST